MSSKTFKFLVEVTTTDENVVENRGWYSAAEKFKKNMIMKIIQAVATYPDLVMIDVDNYEEEDEKYPLLNGKISKTISATTTTENTVQTYTDLRPASLYYSTGPTFVTDGYSQTVVLSGDTIAIPKLTPEQIEYFLSRDK